MAQAKNLAASLDSDRIIVQEFANQCARLLKALAEMNKIGHGHTARNCNLCELSFIWTKNDYVHVNICVLGDCTASSIHANII